MVGDRVLRWIAASASPRCLAVGALGELRALHRASKRSGRRSSGRAAWAPGSGSLALTLVQRRGLGPRRPHHRHLEVTTLRRRQGPARPRNASTSGRWASKSLSAWSLPSSSLTLGTGVARAHLVPRQDLVALGDDREVAFRSVSAPAVRARAARRRTRRGSRSGSSLCHAVVSPMCVGEVARRIDAGIEQHGAAAAPLGDGGRIEAAERAADHGHALRRPGGRSPARSRRASPRAATPAAAGTTRSARAGAPRPRRRTSAPWSTAATSESRAGRAGALTGVGRCDGASCRSCRGAAGRASASSSFSWMPPKPPLLMHRMWSPGARRGDDAADELGDRRRDDRLRAHRLRAPATASQPRPPEWQNDEVGLFERPRQLRLHRRRASSCSSAARRRRGCAARRPCGAGPRSSCASRSGGARSRRRPRRRRATPRSSSRRRTFAKARQRRRRRRRGRRRRARRRPIAASALSWLCSPSSGHSTRAIFRLPRSTSNACGSPRARSMPGASFRARRSAAPRSSSPSRGRAAAPPRAR